MGLEVARRLAALGHEVVGVRRDEAGKDEVEAAGVRFAAADLTVPGALERLPGPFDWVVNAVSSSRGGVEAYRAVYLEGGARVLEWAGRQPLRKLVYTSSTSMYAQTDGGWVDEDSPATPGTEVGALLATAEGALLAAAREGRCPAVVLRLAGIYGPGRGHLFHQFLAGEARIEGDGSRWINMIHRDDAAIAVIAALERGRPAQVYNVADDEPVTQRTFLEGIAARLGRAAPPAAPPPAPGVRKRGATHKRVSNRKLCGELGWRPVFPSWREGYAAAIAETRAAALLDVQ